MSQSSSNSAESSTSLDYEEDSDYDLSDVDESEVAEAEDLAQELDYSQNLAIYTGGFNTYEDGWTTTPPRAPDNFVEAPLPQQPDFPSDPIQCLSYFLPDHIIDR